MAHDLCSCAEANTCLMPCCHHLKVWIIFEQAHQHFRFALKSIIYVSSLLASSRELSVKFESEALLSYWFKEVPNVSIVKESVGRAELPKENCKAYEGLIAKQRAFPSKYEDWFRELPQGQR